MKTQSKIAGTIAACAGIMFASSDTVTNGLLAIVCFGIAACAFLYAEASTETSTSARKSHNGSAKNAA